MVDDRWDKADPWGDEPGVGNGLGTVSGFENRIPDNHDKLHNVTMVDVFTCQRIAVTYLLCHKMAERDDPKARDMRDAMDDAPGYFRSEVVIYLTKRFEKMYAHVDKRIINSVDYEMFCEAMLQLMDIGHFWISGELSPDLAQFINEINTTLVARLTITGDI